MREIKFRAWHTRRKFTDTSPFVSMANDDWSVELNEWLEDPVDAFSGSPLILMQYTGLKDKNGKEIYEGDIVQIHWPRGMGVYVVKWQNKSDYHLGCWEFTSATNPNHYAGSAGNLVEVIGNIYENPELLG